MNDHSAQIGAEPTRRDKQAQETRAKLVDTALDLFARQGVDNTSIKDIAREAGVAQGLLYHYFASKEDLLWAVLETHTFAAHLQEALPAGGIQPAAEGLREVARQFNAFLGERQPLIRLIQRELQTNQRVRGLWEDSIRHEISILEDYLRTRIESGELRPHDVGVTAHLLMYGVVALYLPGGKSASEAEPFIEEMVKTLMRGVAAEKRQ